MIKAHPTEYAGVLFRSRLEARWAAFLDLLGWAWEYEPIDLRGWTPDFRVRFPCHHSECAGGHTLLVEVKPYFSIREFDGHPCRRYPYGRAPDGDTVPADASAAFGAEPSVTEWEMCHGHGGGVESVPGWTNMDTAALWKQAGNLTQWRPA